MYLHHGKAYTGLPLVALVSLMVVACANPLEHRRVSKAPQSASEVGVVISDPSLAAQSTSQLNPHIETFLNNNPNIRFRVVNQRHGIYELYGVDVNEVRKEFPKALVEDNEFIQPKGFDLAIHTENVVDDVMQTLASADEENDSAEGDNPPEAEEPAEEIRSEVKGCVRDEYKAPTPVMTFVSPTPDELEKSTIELGTTLHISSEKTKKQPAYEGNLRFAWVVVAPAGSLTEQSIIQDKTLEFTPDTLGLYSIALVVQDDEDYCGFELANIVVTGNKPFEKPQVDTEPGYTDSDLDMAQFRHLDQIKAKEAWEISEGENVLIAVIDTGVHYNHAYLAHNIFENTGDIPDNGIDDDNNGFVDDYIGYDFSHSDPYPYDDQGHGSHVAGLAASPMFGAARKAKILPIKALGALGGDIASIVGGIYYAADSGADIINMSFGQYGAPHPHLLAALDYTEEKGVLVAAASGNGHPVFQVGVNTDVMPNFPSALPNDNIVAVAARDSNRPLAPYSNYGMNTVDVVAPGGMSPDDDIVSCYLDNPAKKDLIGMAGTSMAAPLVAGIAAQVLSLYPDLSPTQVKEILIASGTEVEELKEKVQSGRYLEALDALHKAQEQQGQLFLDNLPIDSRFASAAGY